MPSPSPNHRSPSATRAVKNDFHLRQLQARIVQLERDLDDTNNMLVEAIGQLAETNLRIRWILSRFRQRRKAASGIVDSAGQVAVEDVTLWEVYKTDRDRFLQQLATEEKPEELPKAKTTPAEMPHAD